MGTFKLKAVDLQTHLEIQNGSSSKQKERSCRQNASKENHQKEKTGNKKFVQATEQGPSVFRGPSLWGRSRPQSGPIHRPDAQKGGSRKGGQGPATNSK